MFSCFQERKAIDREQENCRRVYTSSLLKRILFAYSLRRFTLRVKRAEMEGSATVDYRRLMATDMKRFIAEQRQKKATTSLKKARVIQSASQLERSKLSVFCTLYIHF